MTPTTAVSLLTYKPEVQIHAAGTTSSYSLVNPRQLSSPAHHPKVKQCLGNALPEARAQHSHRGTGNEHRAVLLNSNHASPIRAKPRGDRRLRCSLRRQGRMQKRRGEDFLLKHQLRFRKCHLLGRLHWTSSCLGLSKDTDFALRGPVNTAKRRNAYVEC